MKMKIVMVANDMSLTGIGQVIMSYLRFIDKEKYQVDLIFGKEIEENWEKELVQMEINFYKLDDRKKKTINFYSGLFKIMKREKYHIIHVHGNSSTMFIELLIAKYLKINHRIAHCHASKSDNMTRHKIFLSVFRKLYTDGLACSSLAGEWIFGNGNFTVINNGIAEEKFRFSKEQRKEYRKKLNLENKFIVGHVGNYSYNKNQDFILEIFNQYTKTNKDAWLMLIGDGYEKFKKKKRVIFCGKKDDIRGYLCAMDVFLLPSINEGFGITLLEAQACGLRCLVSENLPKEVIVGENVEIIPLSDKELWIEKIGQGEDFKRTKCSHMKYDVKDSVKDLEKIYEKMK